MRIISVATLFCVMSLTTVAEPWESMTLAELCETETARVEGLFAALDTSLPGLEAVEAAVKEEDWLAACEALLAYYQARFQAHAITPPAEPAPPGDAAEAILERTFTIQRVTDTVPVLEHGGLDWEHLGPNKDREWAWLLNRQSYLNILLGAYARSGEDRFVQAIDRNMRDWVLHSPYPGTKTHGAQWRGLETALRMHSWPGVFKGLQSHPKFTPAARILMLSTLPYHAHYNRNFHAKNNWLTMEMNGLVTNALTWPEFKGAQANINYAIEQMSADMVQQVYPDGVQTELTSHYHRVAMSCFERFMHNLEGTGVQFPDSYRDTVENMWNYLAYSMRPSGHGVLNNDSDYNYTRNAIISAAERYQRPDWTYSATNGKEGVQPEIGLSMIFPWAGEVIMRSDWGPKAHWLFFDNGPLGTAHVHRDKLHLSVQAYGRDLLVDSGRYSYVGDSWRQYFTGTRSHTTLLIDGCEQQRYTPKAKAPLTNAFRSTPEYDIAQGIYDSEYIKLKGTAAHTRTVVYLRDHCWLVFDHVDSDRPREITALWQFHPDCTVQQGEKAVFTADAGKGNILVKALTGDDWIIDCIAGQEDPIQGWYSVEYNVKVPSTTARFTCNAPKNSAVAWLLYPAEDIIKAQDLLPVSVTALDSKQAQVQVGAQTVAVDFSTLTVSLSDN